MKDFDRFWIVGGSSGIGLELVKILLNDKKKVIVSSRNASTNAELKSLKNSYGNNISLVDLDVTKSINKETIENIWNIFAGIDIWIYNAGAYEIMDINTWDKDKFDTLNKTNYLGVINIMVLLKEYFLNQGHGKWIWNLSISSYFGLPKGGAYSAPKAALLNLAQSIQPELITNNIHLQVINHGFVKTRLTSKNKFEMPQLMTAIFAANKIYEQISKTNKFEIRFPFLLSMFLRFLSLLPYKISLAITKKML